jgi:signal transduction histidine kinase
MAFSPQLPWRRIAVALASGCALAATGAALVVARQMGWWATLLGAALCLFWLIGLGCWSVLQDTAPALTTAMGVADPRPTPPRLVLDQMPVPMIRIDAAGAHAINQSARALFGTDDRILPAPPTLLGGTSDRLRHEGKGWRIKAVETAPGERLVVLIDIEAEERAAEGRATAEMIDILGHELLNGLSPIVSLADSAVTAAARGDAMLPHILATLVSRAEGLEGFTRAYRTLSKLPDPVPTPVLLADLTQDLARLFASHFGSSVALTSHVPPEGVARMDRDQMTQGLWALLQNGAEAALAALSPRRVDLTFDVEADKLTIRVCDTGTGIAAPDRARIFRLFFTTKPQGSGVGLSLARRIARAHGGDLRLLTTRATIFELQVPAHGPRTEFGRDGW